MQEVAFESARKFLDWVRLSNRRWGRRPTTSWVFRGQSDAKWSLLPSAWRGSGHELLANVAQRYYPLLRERSGEIAAGLHEDGFTDVNRVRSLSRVGTAALAHTAAEIYAVDQFLELADNVGLRIPARERWSADDFLARLIPPSLNAVVSGAEHAVCLAPPVDDTFGLAQHHGIPTRLLDCTRNPLVAAFFACLGSDADQLAVWAINTKYLGNGARIRVLTCRRHDNTFLHAQDALFLWDARATEDFAKTGAWPPLEVSIQQMERQLGVEIARKATLPRTQAARLTRLLWRERVSLAHLMPTYDNIARSLLDLWTLTGWATK